MKSPFKAINPATNKVWRLSELWEERQRLADRIIYLESVLEQKKDKEDLLTNQQILNHVKAGLKVHNREFALAVRDVRDAGVLVRMNFAKLPKFPSIFATPTTSKSFIK